MSILCSLRRRTLRSRQSRVLSIGASQPASQQWRWRPWLSQLTVRRRDSLSFVELRLRSDDGVVYLALVATPVQAAAITARLPSTQRQVVHREYQDQVELTMVECK